MHISTIMKSRNLDVARFSRSAHSRQEDQRQPATQSLVEGLRARLRNNHVADSGYHLKELIELDLRSIGRSIGRSRGTGGAAAAFATCSCYLAVASATTRGSARVSARVSTSHVIIDVDLHKKCRKGTCRARALLLQQMRLRKHQEHLLQVERALVVAKAHAVVAPKFLARGQVSDELGADCAKALVQSLERGGMLLEDGAHL